MDGQLGIRAWHQRERAAEREDADDVAKTSGEGWFWRVSWWM